MSAPNDRSLRVAVLGLGPMGMHHVRALGRVPGVVLAAVSDTHPERVASVSREHGCTGVDAGSPLPAGIDAAIVATPPDTHAAIAVPLLRSGIHCLIEKPLAVTPAECAAIAAAAAESGTVAQTGHIERFNPALLALRRRLDTQGGIGDIVARRCTPRAARRVAVDVVTDLMIHDIDIVLLLKRQLPRAVTATRHAPGHVSAVLAFADGSSARLLAQRIADGGAVREMTLMNGTRRYRADYLARTLTIGAETVSAEGDGDALTAELAAFAAACRGEAPPPVTAEDGARAVEVAGLVLAAARADA